MTQPISHTTRIQPNGRVRRTVSLPAPGEIVVRIGQEVQAGQVLARTAVATHHTLIDAARELDVAPDEVGTYLSVEPATAVQQGDLIARRSTLLWNREMVAPVAGTLTLTRHGRLLITHPPDWVDLVAPFAAVVAEAHANQTLVLETNAALITAIWATATPAFGPLASAAAGPADVLETTQLAAVEPGQVVVAGSIDSAAVLEQAQEAGITAVVAGSATHSTCVWAEDHAFPLLLTDGIGRQGMAPHFFAQLAAVHGREASLLHSAPERPELLIVTDDDTQTAHSATPDVRVRVLQPAHISQTGTLKQPYQRLHTLGSGLQTTGADIEISSGRITFVPYANLDWLT